MVTDGVQGSKGVGRMLVSNGKINGKGLRMQYSLIHGLKSNLIVMISRIKAFMVEPYLAISEEISKTQISMLCLCYITTTCVWFKETHYFFSLKQGMNK